MSHEAADLAAFLRREAALQSRERLYGVVDGVRALPLAHAALLEYQQMIHSLFDGPSANDLQQVAPYLVVIDPASTYLERWVKHWGNHAGILLVTEASREDLYPHLRHLFLAQADGGQRYFFRFYDPRVLRVYLPTCTPAEAAEFFGPIRRILVEAAPPTAVLVCTPSAAGVDLRPVPLPCPLPVADQPVKEP